MKKILTFLLVLILLLVMPFSIACNETPDNSDGPPQIEDGGDDTGGDNTGGDDTGGDNTGGDNTGGDNTGGDNTGGDNTGGDNTGGDNTGGDNTGGDNTGGDNTGTTDPKPPMSGAGEKPDDDMGTILK